MSNSIPKLKKGMKALACTKKGKFFHLQWALMSTRIYPHHSEAFKIAADMILDAHQSAKGGPHHDTLVFPVLYLYRHCLELKLKELILLGVQIRFFAFAEVEKTVGEHELCPLWTKAKRFLLDSYPKDDQAQAAEAIINEFHRIDPDGQTLRYDRKRGTLELRQFKEIPSHVGIADLRMKMDSLYHYLDSAYAGIADWWDEGQQAMD